MFEATHICKACGTIDTPYRSTSGTLGGELLVWIACIALAAAVHWAFILGAVIYSFSRYSGGAEFECPKCESKDVIPLDSPIGKALAQGLEPPQPGR